MDRNSENRAESSDERAETRRTYDTGRGWRRFTVRLAACLSDLREDEYLILTVQDRPCCYVQFAAQGRHGMRAEAVSNVFIKAFVDDPRAWLSDEDRAVMVSLDWHPPKPPRPGRSRDRSGSPNFFIDQPQPVDFRQVATLAADTLRHVHRVRRPGSLRYKAFTSEGAEIRFPTLGVEREA